MTTPRPKFRIARSRNGQWTAILVAANGETVWQTEQFTTLGKAEESLFHVVDEVDAILGAMVDGDQVCAEAIPYELSVAYTRGEREYEPRVAHRPAGDLTATVPF